MAKQQGKVTRLFRLTAQPIGKDKFAVSFSDLTTRSDADKRITTTETTADSFSGDGLMEGIAGMFKRFKKTLTDEDPGELFSEPKSAKPKRDPK